jgi:hypothetical protein
MCRTGLADIGFAEPRCPLVMRALSGGRAPAVPAS